jgi:2,3-bisphosphoglycerate-independent phosphoglycerate mutase
MSKKCVLILLDGLGDRSYAELAYQTPLQAGRTPFMDKIAASGANGLYHAALLGQALPSENAHFAGLREENNCFFLVDGKPEASFDEVKLLIEAAGEYSRDGVEIRFIHTQGLRGILVLRGKAAPFITDTDPFIEWNKGKFNKASVFPTFGHVYPVSFS